MAPSGPPWALMAAMRICGLGGRDARSGMPQTSVKVLLVT